jgi:hypothetical protein
MKSILPVAGLLAASIAAAPAASIVVNTVGVINTNGHTIVDTPGSMSSIPSISNTGFASDMTTAFANNTGGVWNFDGTSFNIGVGETVTLNYGTSLANSLVMTLGGTNAINTGFITTAEATSGTQGLGLDSNASTRTFTLSTPLLTLGMFIGNRGDSSRISTLTVTYQDNSTATVTGAHMGPTAGSNYFQGVSGTLANPIVSFSLAQNNFVRYDDLGFVAVPEPSSALLLGLVGFGAVIRRRR